MIGPARIVERQRRWLSLATAGGAAAQADAVDAFRGCAAALREISRELGELRYPVADIVVPSAVPLDALVRDAERRANLQLPPVLVEFWRTVGGVSFVDVAEYAHMAFWDDIGVEREYCDGVMVDACTPEWVDFFVDDVVDQQSESADEAPLILLSPDGYHKDNISGGEAYGIAAGGGWFATWENFDWVERPASAPTEPIDFLGYLRTAVLECAGFPGLFGDAAFEPIRQRLLRNVHLF